MMPKNALQQIKTWEMEHFLGVFESTTALQTLESSASFMVYQPGY